jgi:hypothetical protein
MAEHESIDNYMCRNREYILVLPVETATVEMIAKERSKRKANVSQLRASGPGQSFPVQNKRELLVSMDRYVIVTSTVK